MTTEAEQTVEQRLAERLGLKIHGSGEFGGLKVVQFLPGNGGWLKIAALWDEVVRLEREHQVMRDALNTVLLRFGVRSGECNTCDLRRGKHSADCPIPKIERVLSEIGEKP